MALAKLIHPDERGLVRRVTVCPSPTDTTENASYAITWTNGKVTKITKTIAGTSYERTLGYSGTELTSVGTWSEV